MFLTSPKDVVELAVEVIMGNISKLIRLSEHAKEQLVYRGGSKEEVHDAIRTSNWIPSQLKRMECRKDFKYNKDWNNKFYKTKQVRPIFTEEENEIVVVTVYVYYYN